MRILMAYVGDTLTVSPLNKRERFPVIERLEVIDRTTYAIAADIFNTRIVLGDIKPGYEMVSKNKYEIIFKTKTPPKRMRRTKKRKNMYIFFDTETNGKPIDYKASIYRLDNWPRVIQLGWAIFDEKGAFVKSKCDLIIPNGWEVPTEKFWIDNGFSTEKNAKEGISITDALNAFVAAANECHTIIAHNIAFDYKVLGAEALRANLKTQKKLIQVCTMEESTEYCKLPSRGGYGYKWPSLTELHTILFKKPFDGAHDALSDVMACANCFFELKKLGVIK